MNPATDSIARDACAYASAFHDQMTIARCKSGTAEQRQAAAAKAMMTYALLEEAAAELKKHMPRSTEEGTAMRRDLQEIAR